MGKIAKGWEQDNYWVDICGCVFCNFEKCEEFKKMMCCQGEVVQFNIEDSNEEIQLEESDSEEGKRRSIF